MCINCVKSPIDVISRENTFCSLACAEAYVVRWRLNLGQETSKTDMVPTFNGDVPRITPTLEPDYKAPPYSRYDKLLLTPVNADKILEAGYVGNVPACGVYNVRALITLFHPKWRDQLQELCETHPE